MLFSIYETVNTSPKYPGQKQGISIYGNKILKKKKISDTHIALSLRFVWHKVDIVSSEVWPFVKIARQARRDIREKKVKVTDRE